MALLPVTLRRRLRASGFTEEQTDALDEASDATAEAARTGLAKQDDVRDEFNALRIEMREFRATLRAEMGALRTEMAALRTDMNAIKWWLFGTLSLTMLAATGAIIAAIAVWG